MFLLVVQGLLIVVRIFLSVNLAALSVGSSLAKKTAKGVDTVSDSAIDSAVEGGKPSSTAEAVGSTAKVAAGATGKVASTTLKGASVVADVTRPALKSVIAILDIFIGVSLLITVLVIVIVGLVTLFLLMSASLVSLNFLDNCEKPDKAEFSEVAEASSEDSDSDDKKEEKKKQKDCTPIGSAKKTVANDKGKEEKSKSGASGSNSEAVNKMIAYFEGAQGKVFQDCTDAVQNALDAAGIMPSRAKGGYDMGPQHSDWITHGKMKSMGQLPRDQWKAGDVISVPGHVYMYLGDGKFGHGGWPGNQTVVNDYQDPRSPSEVARYVG